MKKIVLFTSLLFFSSSTLACSNPIIWMCDTKPKTNLKKNETKVTDNDIAKVKLQKQHKQSSDNLKKAEQTG